MLTIINQVNVRQQDRLNLSKYPRKHNKYLAFEVKTEPTGLLVVETLYKTLQS